MKRTRWVAHYVAGKILIVFCNKQGRHRVRHAALSLRGCVEVRTTRARAVGMASKGGVVLCVCDGGSVREAARAGAAGVAGGARTPDAK